MSERRSYQYNMKFEPPKGYVMIDGFKYHCINKEMKIYNIKLERVLNTYKNNKGVIQVVLTEFGKSRTRSVSKLYADAFFEAGQKYVVGENGIPIKSEKTKRGGARILVSVMDDNGKVFNSIKECSEFHNVHRTTVKSRIKRKIYSEV